MAFNNIPGALAQVDTLADLPPIANAGDLATTADTAEVYVFDGSVWVLRGASVGGVSSLNGETGSINIVAGSGITVTPAGQNITIASTGGGTVTSVSVASANGLAGTVANSTTTPAITLSTTITGVLKGNGTAISAATSGTDYSLGTSGNATGIVKSTTGTGALTTAVAGDFPTLNQNTTGNAATVTTNANLTGDVTSVGNATTLATVNSNVGSFGTASNVSTVTVNAKGLITAASNTPIQITESQVTNLTSDLAAKQSSTLTNTHILVGNASNIATDVAFSGDATLANTGAMTLATVNSSPGGFGSASTSLSATVNAKGLITSLASQSIQVTESQVTNLVSDLAAKQSATLTNTHILVGNASNVATDIALSGDATLANTGAITLATVNSNVGSFGSASSVMTQTVNAKGLTTAAASVAIQIAESQVTNLVSDLAAKQSTTLTSAHLLVGNGSNVATDVAASGDLTLANTGAFTVAKIAGTTVSGTTGSGNVVFSTSPTLVTPALGTPSALVGTNITGTASGLTAGTVTTNANLTGPITSVGNATSVASQTGTGSTFVMNTAPTISNPIVGTQSQGDSSTKAASTAYVDVAVANAVAGVNPAVAVQAATTSAADTSTYTYNNGATGIGATLTAPSNNVALTVDGYTFTAIGQRLLVKNDTQSPSGAYNGIYNVTQIQTAILPVILTRALDYDMPSDMNNTGAIPVINGTVNGTTSWVLTSLVVTVGTSPLTFTEFTRNPADYLLKANNLSDVSSVPPSRVNLNIDQRTAVADTNYTVLATDRYVGLSSITASRTFTLPAASAVNAGQTLMIADESGQLVTGSITLTIQRAASDTLDGATSFVLGYPYGYVILISDGTSKWTYDVTGTGRGGTGSKTLAGARANLNIDKRTGFSNTTYTVLTTDKYVAQTGTMSASRAVTLPAASAVNAGQEFIIADESGTVTPTNTIVVTAAGADTIDGASTATIAAPYGMRRVFSDGTSKWTFDGGVLRSSNNLSDVLSANTSLNNLLPSQTSNSGKYLTTNGTNASWGSPAGSGDVSSNTTSSVVNEIALFADTGGKLIKRSTGTGVAQLTSGVLSTANVDLTSQVTGALPIANGGTAGTSTSTARTNLGILAGSSFLTSGTTFTTPSTVTASTQFKISLIGAGGGTGGVAATANQKSPGGGAGAVAVFYLTGLAASTGYTYAIGSAGTAGTNAPTAGGTGGTTSITIGGTTYSCTGGVGGVVGASGATGAAGGTTTNIPAGSIIINGQQGTSVAVNNSSSSTGIGGSSGMGFGFGGVQANPATAAAGVVGTGYGAGASGATAGSGATASAGALGTQGAILIEYWN